MANNSPDWGCASVLVALIVAYTAIRIIEIIYGA